MEPYKPTDVTIRPLNILSIKNFPVGKNNATGFANLSNTNYFQRMYVNWNP